MRRAAAGLVAAIAAISGCTHGSTIVRSVSRGTRAAAAGADDVPVCGFPVDVTIRHAAAAADAAAAPGGDGAAVDDAEPSRVVEGELVAATGDELWVLGEDGLVRLPASGATVRVSIAPSAAKGLGVLTAIGSVSTVSHGFFLVGTLPVWLAAGIASSVRATSRSFAETSGDDPELAAWARFPQGPPPGWPDAAIPPRRCVAQPKDRGVAADPDGSPDAGGGPDPGAPLAR